MQFRSGDVYDINKNYFIGYERIFVRYLGTRRRRRSSAAREWIPCILCVCSLELYYCAAAAAAVNSQEIRRNARTARGARCSVFLARHSCTIRLICAAATSAAARKECVDENRAWPPRDPRPGRGLVRPKRRRWRRRRGPSVRIFRIFSAWHALVYHTRLTPLGAAHAFAGRRPRFCWSPPALLLVAAGAAAPRFVQALFPRANDRASPANLSISSLFLYFFFSLPIWCTRNQISVVIFSTSVTEYCFNPDSY